MSGPQYPYNSQRPDPQGVDPQRPDPLRKEPQQHDPHRSASSDPFGAPPNSPATGAPGPAGQYGDRGYPAAYPSHDPLPPAYPDTGQSAYDAPPQPYSPSAYPPPYSPQPYGVQPGYGPSGYGQSPYGPPSYGQVGYGGIGSADPYYPPYGRDPVTGEPLSDKSKLTAGLLQIFLGTFGVGRFYIGDTTTGVIQLVLTIIGWILSIILVGLFLVFGVAIWALVDGIMMLSGSVRDKNGLKLRD
ncbi:hypothetical protein GCM10009624_03940 [Gordonia sinesedis]